MKTQTTIALKFLLAMTVLTGIIYPLLMTAMAQLIFPNKANGNLILKDGNPIGSELIGQKFDSSFYFWSRPSAVDYNPIPSAASNFGPTSNKLKQQLIERRGFFVSKNLISDTVLIPEEMIFASGSGLDPHISPRAALLQANRVAKARNLNDVQKKQLESLVNSLVENPQFGIFGERRINVLRLNIETDNMFAR
jgi:K+-transporting ATPase ATPase C chain